MRNSLPLLHECLCPTLVLVCSLYIAFPASGSHSYQCRFRAKLNSAAPDYRCLPAAQTALKRSRRGRAPCLTISARLMATRDRKNSHCAARLGKTVRLSIERQTLVERPGGLLDLMLSVSGGMGSHGLVEVTRWRVDQAAIVCRRAAKNIARLRKSTGQRRVKWAEHCYHTPWSSKTRRCFERARTPAELSACDRLAKFILGVDVTSRGNTPTTRSAP